MLSASALLLITCCVSGTLSWLTAAKRDIGGDGEQELVTLERRALRGLYPSPDQSVGFSAFNKRYHVTLLPSNRQTQSPVPVFTSKRGEWAAEDNKDVEVYKDGDSVLMVTRRGGDIHVDGIVRQHGDEVFVESSPSKRSGVHTVTKSDPNLSSSLQNDYVYAQEHLGNWLRQRKRGSSSGRPAIVEVLVVVDNAIYRQYMEKTRRNEAAAKDGIRKYYMLLIYLVDRRYAEIDDPQVDIRVRLGALYIAQEIEDSLWSEKEVCPSKEDPTLLAVDPTKTLNNLREWLAKNGGERHYDHAMAFTGYQLEGSGGRQTAGMAYIGTVCQLETGYACSLVEEKGGLANVGTAVHELGHNLGANHDGESDGGNCPAAHNYVMAPGSSGLTSVLKNAYVFSPCSLRQFKRHLSTKDAECLFETNSTNRGEAKTPSAQIMTQIMSPDWQCKEVFGETSGQCLMEGFEAANDICLRLWCVSPDNPDGCKTRGGMAALYGTPCGDNMVCRFGECVASDEEGGSPTNDRSEDMTPMNVVDQSPERERMAYAHRGHQGTHAAESRLRAGCRSDDDVNYCRQLISRRSEACRRPDIRHYCCWSCQFYVN